MNLLEALLAAYPTLSEREAKGLILAGKVLIGDTPQTKPGIPVAETVELRLRGIKKFVSRSGEKLDSAIQGLQFPVTGRSFMDIGSSTGGFTDCLLRRGARFVAAIDVGKGLLHQKLRSDARVQVLEGYDFKKIQPADLWQQPEAFVADVSFTSIEPLLPLAFDLLKAKARRREALVLFKPQFELPRAERELLDSGILRDQNRAGELISAFSQRLANAGILTETVQPAAITGRHGNQEYILHLTRP
ncbi:TlyA family RNA methyltransferase [Turneriella parva]|uniref:Ribosomal RNA methyltransferase RrmJ/FtsJ n=1 Tax=Turneriella parva (strain ATCC BAA-1111 / DSM 21527 / NCTC 11395 / H) TaxID=869212 RepID=I4B406_TURPD|nr:TlyA family RNA methyltransferase [Turneriella parva]AFM12013.1 ribosomal RNA methyltransferase RrmJ/FtsJ [Turneriella parva DSM 21527]